MLKKKLIIFSIVFLAVSSVITIHSFATGPLTPPPPSSNSTGLEGKISAPPPSSAPTISSPSAGQTFTQMPITVSGLCNSQIVKIFANNVFVGSAQCISGSYQLQVDLFADQNDLIARQYDALDQQSPDSNTVSVNFVSAQFAQFGTLLALTSVYARKGADPGQELTWPIVVSGGKIPYAVSVDWGDGKPAELLSLNALGEFEIHHTYNTAGTYPVLIKATDANGTGAFLQLVGVANGQVTGSSLASKNQPNIIEKTTVLWWPLIVMLILMIIAFFLGRKQMLASIRHNLEKSRSE